MNNLSEKSKGYNVSRDEENFEKLIEESFDHYTENSNMKKGSLCEGTIIQISDEFVFLNLGLKQEGRIPLSEFSSKKDKLKIGDTMTAVVVNIRSDEIRLSYQKAIEKKTFIEIKQAFDNTSPIKAKIVEKITSGMIAHIGEGEYRAFIPLSQLEKRYITEDEAQNYLGKELDFIILQLYNKKGKLQPMLSHKEFIERRAHESLTKFFQNYSVGDTIEGVVKSFAPFGIFIDLGGFDGLLHNNDMSWSKNIKPKSIAKKNEVLKLKIIKINEEDKQVNLSLKAFSENPWNKIDEVLKVDDIITGTIVKILPYGVFVKINNDFEGFVHVSELSWVQRVNHPKEILSDKSTVKCKVLEINKEEQRISLGIKQIHKNPWEDVIKKYPIGYVINLPIVEIAYNGIRVEFDEGISGLIVKDDITWARDYTIADHYSIGQNIDCKVLAHNQESNYIQLGVKQLLENPWESPTLAEGTVISGTIKSVSDFGVFVRINDEIDGLIPKSHTFNPAKDENYESIRDTFEIGKKIQAVILRVDKEAQRLSLSLRQLREQLAQQDMAEHLITSNEDERNYSIGDIFSE